MHSELTGISWAARPNALTARLQPHERVTLGFLTILAILGFARHVPPGRSIILFLLPVALYVLWLLEARLSKTWTRILREWASLALLLIAYWSLELFAAPSRQWWQSTWLSWDRHILYSIGLKSWIEAGGQIFPYLGVLLSCRYSLHAL